VLSSEPVPGLPGEPQQPDADGLVRVPAFPDLVRYQGTADVRNEQVVPISIGRAKPGAPFFSPTFLTGLAGERVALEFTNTTPSDHNFTLESEHISTAIRVGATVRATVQFPTSGALVFYCKLHAVDSHGGALYTVSA
jgi:plastocyanin